MSDVAWAFGGSRKTGCKLKSATGKTGMDILRKVLVR